MAVDADLREWIARLLRDRYKTKRALAAAAGITESALARQVDDGGLGWKPLLRLAMDVGESPSAVLRLAGKSEDADLIERAYGPPRVIVRPDVHAVAELLEGRSRAYVRSLRVLLEDMPRARPSGNDASRMPEARAAERGTPGSRGARGRKRRGDATAKA